MATTQHHLRYLLSPGTALDAALTDWAPDVFCLVSSLLQVSGAYVRVLAEWPPTGSPYGATGTSWRRGVRAEAELWRQTMESGQPAPANVASAFTQLLSFPGTLLEFRESIPNVHRALELLAVADETCAGFGIESPQKKYEIEAELNLVTGVVDRQGSTLCSSRIDRELGRVLPKQHTPVVGMTLRSLSHHLAFHPGSEVVPFWQGMPKRLDRGGLNVLVAPWPLRLHRTQFAPKPGTLREMPDGFGFMTFSPRATQLQAAVWFRDLLASAIESVGRVHLAVFPECALTAAEFEDVAAVAAEHDVVLVSGVVQSGDPYSTNEVVIRSGATIVRQAKHHRWKLDRGQLEQYELAGSLNASVEWWEDSTVEKREVNFVALRNDLTLCCLVCEDLARQDPVATLVRSVGPSLVVAVLMDAPQAAKRWPARYATVLSDDPGSSVLSVTSWGMASMAKPPRDTAPSKAVALWKDAKTGLRELELPEGAEGLVLTLHIEDRKEFSADGRGDGGVAPYPQLAGVIPVRPLRRREGSDTVR